ncbi:MAG TPA: cell surface protein SprA, partial [Cytophagaceae bacterium]
SVTVTAGPNVLQENLDYTIDYTQGKLRIINEGILASGQEIKVKYEKQDLFNFRRKTFVGSRFDYRVNKDINIGATALHQNEAPQLTRVNVGDEPSSNSIIGVDLSVKKDSRLLTKAVDLLPLIQTKAPSSVTFSGEFAQLIPGHSKVVDKGEGGTAFIDDFEGSETPIDLTRQPFRYKLGATPLIKLDGVPTNLGDYDSPGLNYTSHRAKIAWYTIDQLFYRDGGQRPKSLVDEDINNHFVRAVRQQEVFPGRSPYTLTLPEQTLDVAFFPKERGQYNYNPAYKGNNFGDPKSSWGGITRDLRNDIDFENANIQYLEFWMMDPYSLTDVTGKGYNKLPLNSQGSGIPNPDVPRTGGKLYFNLGDISEDIMKDNVHSFENGLPARGGIENTRPTTYGRMSKLQYLTNAFETSTDARPNQDVGLDGLGNADEKNFPNFAPMSDLEDPSGDDFRYYLRGANDDVENFSILQRYKDFNGMEGNSPISGNNSFTPQNYSTPDNEDLNQDNTINAFDNYYQYEVNISPSEFEVGKNFIISRQQYTDDNTKDVTTWYQFRIPIRQPTDSVGEVSGFNSLRFFRMYLTGFEDPILLRFVQLQMVANQWRPYKGPLDVGAAGPRTEISPTALTVSSINAEANGQGNEVSPPYTVPPNFSRDQDITSQNNRQLNEHSLRLCAENFKSGEARAVVKNVGLDLLNYKRLKMFIHAESQNPALTDANQLMAFVRIGTDFERNYYEIDVPLHYSGPTRDIKGLTPEEVWRAENEININLSALTEIKAKRTASNNLGQVIDQVDGRRVVIMGNPDLSATQGVMIGLRNTAGSEDTREYSACIWVNELRVTEFIEQSGFAATASMNVKLADLANITATGRYMGVGFGSLDQRVSQRSRVATGEYGVQANIALDKFVPDALGLKLPFYTSYNRKTIAPKYDPLDPDVLLTSSLGYRTGDARAAYRKLVLDEETRRSYNFTNIQKIKTKPNAKPHFYDVENLNFSVGYSETRRTNINIANFTNKLYNAGVGYSYSNTGKSIEPFKKMESLKSPYLKLVKELNFTLLPSSITFRSDLLRRITTTQFYEGRPTDGRKQDPYYEKSFFFNRNYGLVWALTKSITVNYSAVTNAIIDEPDGNPDTVGYNRELWGKVKQLGRTKNYTQSVTGTYRLPFDKLPITDWLSADVSYGATYNWVAGSRDQQVRFGNSIQNTRDLGLNGRIGLDKLYNKVKFLKEINTQQPKPKKTPVPIKVDPAKKDTTKKEEPKRELRALKAILRGAMSIKSLNFSYKLTEGMRVGGYLGTANIVGLDRNEDPGLLLPFTLGWQDPDIRYRLANEGLISRDRKLQDRFATTRSQNFNAQTSLEPVKDFSIRLTAVQTRNTSYSEFFKMDTLGQNFISFGPDRTGTFSTSYVPIASSFWGKAPGAGDDNSSRAFQQFEQNRAAIHRRIGNSKIGINSQEVLIPAFLSAYSDQNPEKISLNPTPRIPLPNWNISFTGLTKIEKLKKLFPTISLNHGYNSTYAIAGYNSSIYYATDLLRNGPRNDIDNTLPPDKPDTGQFYRPVFVIDQVSLKEAFSPLIGITVKTKNKASYTINYIRERTMLLSMTNAQMQESQSKGITLGLGLNKTGFKIPFRWQGRKIPPLKNELQFKNDITIRDTKTIQRNIGGVNTVTAGTINFQLRTSISYMISQRLNLTFYFDRQINTPRISSSFRRAATAFGLQLRFTLS